MTITSLLRSALAYLLVAAVLVLISVDPAAARPQPGPEGVDEDEALAVSQSAIGRLVGDYAFTDRLHRSVRLADFQGKPLIVSMIYTGCADICPMVSETLSDAIEVARDALGEDSFRIVTVGFDARNDTPERMRAYARSHGLAREDWRFLSADADTVDRLATDLGFLFFASPKGFDHLSQTTVVDAEGRVYRQIYGAGFETPQLVEPLKQLVFGRRADLATWSGIVNKVRLFCTIFDPASDRYKFDYSIFISIVMGSLSLGGILFVLVRGWLRNRRLGLG